VAARLQDKVCIITGTGDGMGRAAALLFCSEGAKVVGCDVNAQKAELTLRDAKSAGGEIARDRFPDVQDCLAAPAGARELRRHRRSLQQCRDRIFRLDG
jgi:NAD(P)-dependent dehydrogenase (short-subunit alcohol dehydrogenase family)